MLIYKIILCVLVFAVSLGAAAYMTWGERKLAAWLQDRVGPNRAGPLGLLQPIADGLKMIFKEEMIPTHSNRWLFVFGPSFFMLCACMTGVVIPWGAGWTVGDTVFPMQVTDINIGLLYLLGVVSIGVYGVMIGGWASNNKYSLLGALRASSQMMPECESELVGGYHTEYSSMKLGFFLFAEYINMFISSAIMASLYFGGYNFPFQHELGLSGNGLAILQTAFLFGKIFIFIFIFMWVRWTLPRFRYDQLMNLGWKVLLPLAIANVIITGFVMLFLGKLG